MLYLPFFNAVWLLYHFSIPVDCFNVLWLCLLFVTLPRSSHKELVFIDSGTPLWTKAVRAPQPPVDLHLAKDKK